MARQDAIRVKRIDYETDHNESTPGIVLRVAGKLAKRSTFIQGLETDGRDRFRRMPGVEWQCCYLINHCD